MKKAYLVLQNGKVFEGQAIGAEGIALGEMVFTTGVVGYVENLTDPCYTGQIVMQTFPVVGNYGVATEDVLGKCAAAGFVVRELCDEPSNFRSEMGLDEYLKANKVVGICGIDTRELTSILRDEGVMNAMICTEIPADMSVLNDYRVQPFEIAKAAIDVSAQSEGKFKVAVIDCGAGMKLAKRLTEYGCNVTVLTADQISDRDYNGIAISEGPGDPAEYSKLVSEIQNIIGKTPVLGIGLGHQLAILAEGGKTMKLKYGHRGSNQPVKNIENGRVYITTQNHGYIAEPPSEACVMFRNINDGTCEGIYDADKKLLTLQFMPEVCSGPNDMGFVYERFIEMMGGDMNAQR
ncbi:MAG: glutamine-hydrolyzing carbamoyl-phosphate synthase small subunit [Clostridia bacterium]|nr:glutamine-hydrolyzing carbamoyl-phosphate synthase small subunit [Clostridia bacterium]